MSLSTLREQHLPTLELAVNANTTREFYAHWPEAPSGKIYGETANADGEAAFKAQLGSPFQGLQQHNATLVAASETSPYGFDLGITYPELSVPTAIELGKGASAEWATLDVTDRAVLLIEALERASKRFFEIGYATQHTTGQGFVMAFQASGPHAFDRALEAIAMGYAAQTSFADSVLWTKPMGKVNVSIQKTFRNIPKGINVVIGCSTFPVWNTTPGLFAGLITGNTVIVKPHPQAIYPIAIIVAALQQTFAEYGLLPNIVQLLTDTTEAPVTLELIENPAVKIIDYTGGPAFGAKVEEVAAKSGKTVYTEKAGVNTMIVESVENLDAVVQNIAFALSLYSGQMCTAPQNIYVPKTGITTPDGVVSLEEFEAKLAAAIDGLVFNEKVGPGTLGAIQNPATAQRVEEAKGLGLRVIRKSTTVAQNGFENARSVSPIVLGAAAEQADIYNREWFGPITFVVACDSFADAVQLVSSSIEHHGALTTLVYTTNATNEELAEQVITSAGAPVAFNFNSFVWVNQSAAFSDFHGTGANPAGNAAFADWSFVCNRYNVVGVRKQA